jgi:hypothetical protein
MLAAFQTTTLLDSGEFEIAASLGANVTIHRATMAPTMVP